MAFVKKLDAEHAVIHTATVSVKTLTISGKQVTLAVYRQLPKREIIDEETGLIGIPWGTVNYHPTDCLGYYPHLHAVWQKDSLLFRSDTRAMPSEFETREKRIIDMLEVCSRVESPGFRDAIGVNEGPKIYVTLAGQGTKGFDRSDIEKGTFFWLKEQEDLNRKIDQWHNCYEQLADLDQLFIAV